MASLVTVRLDRGNCGSWGFRLQGGKDFGTPLVVQKVNVGSPAERAGLSAGDSVIKINNTEVYDLRHKDAQDVVVRAGNNIEMVVQRGGSTWKPHVMPLSTNVSHSPVINNVSAVTQTSLKHNRTENVGAIGTGHNLSARPFSAQNGTVNGGPKLVNKQYNSPLHLYSDKSIAETLAAQSEVLSTGALGVNFKKNEKDYDASKSSVFRVLQESENEPRSPEGDPDSGIDTRPNLGIAGLRHVSAPETKPPSASPQLPPGQNICADCERLIVGVFVRIKDKNLHVECFKCATCGTSLKNAGYYNINNKLYCDVHAKLAARNNAPASNLVPITVPPGGKPPSHAISSALAFHSSLPTPSPASPKLNNYGTTYQDSATGNEDAAAAAAAAAAANTVAMQNLNITNTEANINKPNNTSSVTNHTPVSFSKYMNKGSLSSPRPFSSVSAPGSSPRAPLSPVAPSLIPSYSPAPPPGHSVQNTVWPPVEEEKTDLPTASPLYVPNPSCLHVHPKTLTSETTESECEYTAEASYEEDFEELNMMAQFQDPKLSLCSEEVTSFTGRRSAVECAEAITETLETQQLVEGIMKSRPRSPTPDQDIKSDMTVSRRSAESKTSEEYTANTIEIRSNTHLSKLENPVPKGWESPMLQALKTIPDGEEAKDHFSQIPTKHSSSALASALATAPAAHFTPVTNQTEPVPLPELTDPYFPPEHPVSIEPKPPKPPQEDTAFVKALQVAPDRPFTPVDGPTPPRKKKDPTEVYFKELPKPQEKLSMLAALTTAPDRPYSPLIVESVGSTSEQSSETTTKKEIIDKKFLQKPQKPAELPESFKKIEAERAPKPPSYYFPVIQQNIEHEEEESESKQERRIKQVKTIETTEERQTNPSVSFMPIDEEENKHFAPVFSGFSCYYQKNDAHFSVEVSTTPPIYYNREKSQTPQSHGESVDEKVTKTEKIIQESVTMEEESKRQKKVKQQQTKIIAPIQPQGDECLMKQAKGAIEKQAETVVLKKPLPLASHLHKPEGLPQYQVNLSETAEAELKLMEKVAAAQHRLEEKKIAQQAVESKTKRVETARHMQEEHRHALERSQMTSAQHLSMTQAHASQVKEVLKKPIIVVQPGDQQQALQAASFKPVEDRPQSTSFSPRPRSLTPSMINKPPAILPYYQASLVPQHFAAPKINVLDPLSPAISRSPSPCPDRREGRSPSPFTTPSSTVRPKSPAAGPPPNPLTSGRPLPTPTDSRREEAKKSLTSFIPEYRSKRELIEQSKGLQMQMQYHSDVTQGTDSNQQHILQQQTQPIMYTSQVHSRTVPVPQYHESQITNISQTEDATLMQKRHESGSFQSREDQTAQLQVKSDGGSCTSTTKREQSKRQHAQQQKNIETVEKSHDGLLQVQKKRTVHEEYERTQKSCEMQIEKNVTATVKHPFHDVNLQAIQEQAVVGMHVTNPQKIASPFLKDGREPICPRTGQPCTQDVQESYRDACQLSAKQSRQECKQTIAMQSREETCQLEELQQATRQKTSAQSRQTTCQGVSARSQQATCSDQERAMRQRTGGLSQQGTCQANSLRSKQASATNQPQVDACVPPPPLTLPNAPKFKPVKHVSAPVGSNKDVPSPNAGSGGGRQTGAIGVSPRRGRGVLNAASFGGVRIPLCGSCHSQIRGPFITALGRIWCPDHFICSTPSCRRPLQDMGFVEERGQLYCEYCFEQYLAPPCSKCGAKIKGDCLKAIGKNFHPECFNCSYCGKLFGNNPFFLEDGAPYCEADWNELFTTKCFACGFPIEAGDRWVEALSNNYHSQCFNCYMCKKNLEGQSFCAKGNRPYCKAHAR